MPVQVGLGCRGRRHLCGHLPRSDCHALLRKRNGREVGHVLRPALGSALGLRRRLQHQVCEAVVYVHIGEGLLEGRHNMVHTFTHSRGREGLA